ncbi:hypothetical protein HYALB_00000306 [Hymenoscyphus albidus]|uniref:USP domain-containing protein n=1 Tax=Hymenoscyphus albidus TaxID=595503 RepID=A0A9N9Q9N2_9HELO|nr:hypothetical protein HYALB_00000306 [Hymenoscyphus albidus]
MDPSPAELSRERAVSSEPCSTRPNPFKDDDPSARKRQRVSREESRSRSVDTVCESESAPVPPSSECSTKAVADPAPPHTPTRIYPPGHPTTEPTSSRVTINLRTAPPLESIPSSPPSPTTPTTLSKMANGEEADPRASIESESDALSTAPAVGTPTSSPSVPGSPPIEVIPLSEDDGDFEDSSPAVAILDTDKVLDFPFLESGEPLPNAIRRVANFLQYEEIATDEVFCKLRDWMNDIVNETDSFQLYRQYCKYREFWQALPDVFWALNSRSRFFGEFLRRDPHGRQSLCEMFSQFARLAGRFVAMDVKTSSQKVDMEQDPDLGSKRILEAFGFLLRKEETTHIGKNLETHYEWAWDQDVVRMMTYFISAGGTISNLTKLVGAQLAIVPRNPRVIENLVEPSRLAFRAISSAAKLLEGSYARESGENAKQVIADGYKFFKLMSSGLDTIIDKHVTYLTTDAAQAHVHSLLYIFEQAMKYENDETRALLDKRQSEHPETPRKYLSMVFSYEWRFVILKKLITSAQMQLRVVGTTTMCSDLLRVYNMPRANDPPRSIMLLFLAHFVLNNKLIEYLVGIGSHPEIINESSNILGFLIVTKTYTPELTDLIWRTVTTSQDPRVVEAILRMIKQCINLYDYAGALYIISKVGRLPIEAFNTPMREFCEVVFHQLAQKAIQENVRFVDALPYQLCVRLIRESSIINSAHPAGLPDIQNFAAFKLRELLTQGPEPKIREEIYSSCIEEISSRQASAPGSICVLYTFIKHHLHADLRTLTTQSGLTQILIEELEYTIAGNRDSSVRNTPASVARRDLILLLIVHHPETITSDLGRCLWDHLVGSESKNMAERADWWNVINNAVKRSPNNNPYLVTCFKEHLPNLPPHCFTMGTLEFARSAVRSWLEAVGVNLLAGDTRAFETPPLEQIWRMILTAPPNTIDAAAITILVEVYVDSVLITSMPRATARSIHLVLVDRCLKQLSGAASRLKSFSEGTANEQEDGMVIVPSEAQFQEQERIFARSLAVLREFLKAYQLKPRFATPKPKLPPPAVTGALEGEPITLKYQSFDGNNHTEVKSLTIGSLNTAAALFASLQKATGFRNYKVFCQGKEFDPDEVEVCKSLQDLNVSGLVLVQRRDGERSAASFDVTKTTLELEIMKHFEELWSYLSMQEKVAQEIYHFLIKFPVYDRILKEFDDESMPYTQIFPQGQPFRCLYAIHVLREYIAGQSQKGVVNEAALTRAVSLIVAAISDEKVFENCTGAELKDRLTLHFIDCFIQFLKEPLLPPSVAPYLTDVLLSRLLTLLEESRSCASTPQSVNLTCRLTEALLEASLHNATFWESLVIHLNNGTLLHDLVIGDSRSVIRKSFTKQIMNKCTYSPSPAQVPTTGFLTEFWPMLGRLIPKAVDNPRHCEEIFLLAHALFKRLVDTSVDSLRLGDLMKEWGALLLRHKCIESVGHPESIDMVAHGLANLIFSAASFAKASQQSLASGAIGCQIFRKHLFPETHLNYQPRSDETLLPNIPLLNSLTRQIMSEAVFLLVKDDEKQYKLLLGYLLELVSYDDRVQDGPYSYELNWLHDRSKSIRSGSGYVGLRNLSNTCYLNSLFTQLFMNVPFREFMLRAPVADLESQKLLNQTQILFANMQNSLTKAADPQNLAASILTYEESVIDVNIQMDVDEFYNLLFDRWEGQFLASEAKKHFRSFYGGQLVQQVKSKECSHISERLEIFSAIQCDIKGKSSLQESLQAYVDGEVMEGDNKYKCSTCDRHVDAVKRACLKEIPDNLIFHLKRFDFNLRTMQRSKINDHFSFPNKIDMRPYKVEHLMESPEQTSEDVFELVGVLVHAGTAESGHYYSFIRERPSTSDNDNWVEFNDDNVTPWDPANMENATFGGIDYRGQLDNGNMTYDKSYSAYMLFYQRSSSLKAQKQSLEVSGKSSPVRLPIPCALSNHIAVENELLMRKYALYDPSHLNFVLKMLGNVKKISEGSERCSENHHLEKLALNATFHHLDQVVTRTKELPDFTSYMNAIHQMCESCAECTRDYLEWYCNYPEILRQLLFRNNDGVVRSEIATSIYESLQRIKADLPYAYGLSDIIDLEDEVDGDSDPQLLQNIVKGLNNLWDQFHNNCRAWPEYFGLLASIASMGQAEAVILLDAGYLRRTLEIVSADNMLPLTTQLQRMLLIVNKRQNSRPVSFEAVIKLLHRLLRTCDLSEEAIDDKNVRFDPNKLDARPPLTHMERDYLTQHWTRSNAHILVEKLLQINQNFKCSREIIIALIRWPEDDLDPCIYSAISHGIRKGTTNVGPFLAAALLYCEYTESENVIPLIEHVVKATRQLDTAEGRDFLQFFTEVVHISPANRRITRAHILSLCLDLIGDWAPRLLTYFDANVRNETVVLLGRLLTTPWENDSAGKATENGAADEKVRQAGQKLAFDCLAYLDHTFCSNARQAVRSTVQQIQTAVENCETFFEGEEDVALRDEFDDQKSKILKRLRDCTIEEEVDEEVSDWAGSDDEYGSSEPVDSLELCGPLIDDPDQL